jgi:hypothetical protein
MCYILFFFQLLGSGMSNKMWESTVEHARECVLDDKLYSYCSGHGIVLLFNCIYEVVGVIVGCNCFTLNALTPTQKVNSREQTVHQVSIVHMLRASRSAPDCTC